DLTLANAELRSANEELLVGSEEVQAATEEIETLNEELQATNEELETLNEELQATVEELNTTNDDLEARSAELEEAAAVVEDERKRTEAGLVALGDRLMASEEVIILGANGRPIARVDGLAAALTEGHVDPVGDAPPILGADGLFAGTLGGQTV